MEFLAMDEGDIDHSRYGWGAEKWVTDSQIVVALANRAERVGTEVRAR